jgi:Leucine-rich repeat (LRR) protein
MKTTLLILMAVALVGCGERSSNDVEALKAENEKLRVETEVARLKAENAQLKAALSNNSAIGAPTQTGDMKTCYWCEESIKAAAQICKHCGKNPSSPVVQRVEKAIRFRLDKPTGELTKADLEKVTKLNFGGDRLGVVPKGLERLTQLTQLFLNHNNLTNVKGLEKLIQLEGLLLHKNQLTNVRGLEKLTQLTDLSLQDNLLTDVKGLEKLTQLMYLNLRDNPDLTKAQIAELQKALPNCKIHSNPKK